MTHEKTFVLPTGRAVKVITKGALPANRSKIKVEVEVLIKDPAEKEFRSPIGITHPKYWKLKKLGPQESRLVEIKYCGLTDKQIRKAVREFEQIISLDASF